LVLVCCTDLKNEGFWSWILSFEDFVAKKIMLHWVGTDPFGYFIRFTSKSVVEGFFTNDQLSRACETNLRLMKSNPGEVQFLIALERLNYLHSIRPLPDALLTEIQNLTTIDFSEFKFGEINRNYKVFSSLDAAIMNPKSNERLQANLRKQIKGQWKTPINDRSSFMGKNLVQGLDPDDLHPGLNWPLEDFYLILARSKEWLQKSLQYQIDNRATSSNFDKQELESLQRSIALIYADLEFEDQIDFSECINLIEELGCDSSILLMLNWKVPEKPNFFQDLSQRIERAIRSGDYFRVSVGGSAIRQWAVFGNKFDLFPPVPTDLINSLINGIRFKYIPALDESIEVLAQMIFHFPELFDKRQIDQILEALEMFQEEFSIPISSKEFEDKLKTGGYGGNGNTFSNRRILINQMAIALYKRLKDSIPEVISNYREAGLSDRLPIVRFMWKHERFLIRHASFD
jgi:hypothetical protein